MTAPDRRELEEALALNIGDYKAWVKAHGKLRDAVLRLEAELAACLAQNEKIAEMRIDDCERADAAESKIAIIEAELAKERENREREKAEDVRLVEAAHNRAEAAEQELMLMSEACKAAEDSEDALVKRALAAEKEAAAWKSQSYADIVALGVMTKERDAARAEAERLRRTLALVRDNHLSGNGCDSNTIKAVRVALSNPAPRPPAPAEKICVCHSGSVYGKACIFCKCHDGCTEKTKEMKPCQYCLGAGIIKGHECGCHVPIEFPEAAPLEQKNQSPCQARVSGQCEISKVDPRLCRFCSKSVGVAPEDR